MNPPTIIPLPDDITALFANTRQATAAELITLENATSALRTDPRFLAEILKGLAKEENLRSLEKAGLKRGILANIS
jgi:hypothetical protein